MRQLLANDEMMKETNSDLATKLATERENLDKLRTEKIKLEETLSRLTVDFKDDTDAVKDQDEILA